MPTPRNNTPTIIAVDPGRDKCGLAVVCPGRVVFRAIVPSLEIGLTCYYLLQQYPEAPLLVGGLTGSREVREAIRKVCPAALLQTVAEDMSTLKARQRYWLDNPPSWWQRLLPAGMRLPGRPVDDYAAVVLAEAYLDSLA